MSALKTQVSTHSYISKTWYLCQPSKHKSQLTIILARMTWYLCQPSKHKSQLSIILERTTSIILSLFELFGFLFYCVSSGLQAFFPGSGSQTRFLPDRVHRLHQTGSCAWSSLILSIETDLKKKKKKKKKKSCTFKSDVTKKKEKCFKDTCVNYMFQPTCFWVNTGCTCVIVSILNHAASLDVFHCKKPRAIG